VADTEDKQHAQMLEGVSAKSLRKFANQLLSIASQMEVGGARPSRCKSTLNAARNLCR